MGQKPHLKGPPILSPQSSLCCSRHRMGQCGCRQLSEVIKGHKGSGGGWGVCGKQKIAKNATNFYSVKN